MDLLKAMGIIEGILFVSGDPVTIDEISKTLNITSEQVLECVEKLKQNYNKPCHGLMVSRVGKRLRLTTKPDIFPYIETMFKPKVKSQLSKAALETLAIIMFKQPVTRTEIEAIRGVNVERALSTLQERNLICEIGRLNIPGRPILYATTEQCMDYFGLESIEDITAEKKR
ncbi:MAG TPA: SMC-Scp complex subunit ScpB [Thermoanaerobacterales bacterium]|jgi:segregation and condensation protein B|nr:SMC-Scp complex subunit ScpB [Thermoanaerobacterales bacterium]